MEQKIVCVDGKCFDVTCMLCDEMFEDPLQVIECELMRSNYIL